MRTILPWAAAAAILAIPASGWAQSADPKPAQETQSQTPAQSSAAPSSAATNSTVTASAAPQQDSLAEAARKAREAKKDATKSAKVFTNDNIPATGGISTVGNRSTRQGSATRMRLTPKQIPQMAKKHGATNLRSCARSWLEIRKTST